jgi:hypothetical protein
VILNPPSSSVTPDHQEARPGGDGSIITRTSSAPTADTLDLLVLFQLFARHAADAGAVEIGLFGLDAAETT